MKLLRLASGKALLNKRGVVDTVLGWEVAEYAISERPISYCGRPGPIHRRARRFNRLAASATDDRTLFTGVSP